jgi:hypothetical protein
MQPKNIKKQSQTYTSIIEADHPPKYQISKICSKIAFSTTTTINIFLFFLMLNKFISFHFRENIFSSYIAIFLNHHNSNKRKLQIFIEK